MKIILGKCLKCKKEDLAVMEPRPGYYIAYCLICIEKAFAEKA